MRTARLASSATAIRTVAVSVGSKPPGVSCAVLSLSFQIPRTIFAGYPDILVAPGLPEGG
jgi:hypothetical protein